MKLKKTESIRIRVEAAWKRDLEVFAQFKKLDTSDIVRMACDEFRARHLQGQPTLIPQHAG